MLISKSDLKSLKKQYNFLMHNKFYISVRYVHGIPNQKLSTCVVGLFEAGLFLDFFLGKKYIYNIKDISNVFYSTYYIVIEFADNSFWTLVGNEKQVTKIYSILTTEYNISSISKNITDYLPNIIPSNSVSETLEHNEISALTNTENEIETPDKAGYELPVQIMIFMKLIIMLLPKKNILRIRMNILIFLIGISLYLLGNHLQVII